VKSLALTTWKTGKGANLNKHLIVLTSVATIVSISVYAGGREYKTPEFRDGKSSIAMMYTCAVIGEKGGFDADAMPTVAKGSSKMGIPAQKAGELMSDALIWWDSDRDKYDIAAMWDGACKAPIENMRRIRINK